MDSDKIYLKACCPSLYEVNLAERLRRSPAKAVGSARVGSNPAVDESFFTIIYARK
jgi:hypothetical protein